MSIKALCSIHDLEIHEVREVAGQAFGTKRVLVLKNTIKCRVIPLSSSQTSQLAGTMGFVVTHRIRFYLDPKVTEEHWLKWVRADGSVVTMRPRGIAYDAHGLGRMWQLNADASTWQTENLDEQVQ